jgi:hypothetical protein
MPDNAPISLGDLASALLRLPPVIREYLGYTLLDSTVDEEAEGAIDEEAHRRAMEMEHDEVAGVDADDMIVSLRTRKREADIDALRGRRSASAVGGIPTRRGADAGLR